jgi:hypothetical protein
MNTPARRGFLPGIPAALIEIDHRRGGIKNNMDFASTGHFQVK